MNKKASWFILPAMIIGSFNSIQAQSADEIIASHIDAHGGQQAWDRVEAIKVTGKFTAFSLENDYTAYKTKDGSYYGDLYMGEKPVIEAIHGGEGWTIDPWQGMDYARPLNSVEMNALMQKAEFITPFLDYKEKGNTVEYTGLDTVDGRAMHVLALTRTNGKVETWYLDAESFLEYKCKSEWVDFARMAPGETYFDDFREVDGLVFPFFVERTFWQRDRILLVEEIGINPEVDQTLFVMPRRPEMDKLAFMAGAWNVSLEVMTRRGTWYPMGKTTSVIDFVAHNMLQENITYERIYRTARTRQIAYNESTGYRVSEYDDLTTSITLYEGTLNDTAFIFDEKNPVVVDPESESVQRNRYVLSPLDSAGFVIERQVSPDEGETWMARDRFIYSRTEE